jgi:glycosyltransferase involved in cell wall biosynthesis
MRIALMGGRGIPANYGGFETLMEELSVRLAARGHEVTVYCRVPHIQYAGSRYRGVRLVKLPTLHHKYLDTIVHTTLCAVHALTQRYDLVLMMIAGNSPISWIPRLAGQKVVLHVDGLDWQRAKWSSCARRYIRLCERLAAWLPNYFITDSGVVAAYYRDRMDRAPDALIGYGGHLGQVEPGDTLARFGLEPDRYVLFVGRLVPENCAHHLVEACQTLDHGFRCVVVGDAPYEEEYIDRLHTLASPNTVFTGYLFGQGYRELCSNAYLVVEPSEVGGTHPAIVEAMALGNCVVVNGIAENRETIGEAGLTYDGQRGSAALRLVLDHLLERPEEVERFRRRAREYASQHYRWRHIVDQYEAFFKRCLGSEAGVEAQAVRSKQPIPPGKQHAG